MTKRYLPKGPPLARALVIIGRKHPEYKTRHIVYATNEPLWKPETNPYAGVEVDHDLIRKQTIEGDIANDRDLK
jgi:hypothetical protein